MSALDCISYLNLELSDGWAAMLTSLSKLDGVRHVYPGGSRYIGGYLTDSDVDVVLLVDHPKGIRAEGYVGHNDDYKGEVRSYRKGKVNLIVHESETMYLRTIAATELCRLHAFRTKKERYEAHETIKGEQ